MPETAPLQKAIDKAVEVLRDGGVVAFPTDTLYGLGADAFREDAVERVFEIKGRPSEMALPLLLGGARDLELVATDIPDSAWALVARFWPGPLTLILKSAPEVPAIVTGGGATVAVRVPNHPVPLQLTRRLGRPITGTSANVTGGPDPKTAEDVKRALGDKVDYIIEQSLGEQSLGEQSLGEQSLGEQSLGEQSLGEQGLGEQGLGQIAPTLGTPSTVLDLSGATPRLARQGAIHLDVLLSAIPETQKTSEGRIS